LIINILAVWIDGLIHEFGKNNGVNRACHL
jgi:hypothetical protein